MAVCARTLVSMTGTEHEIFIGYCRKQMPGAPEWLDDQRVSRIASVSECIAKRPEGWVDRWDFNAASLYHSVDAADAATAGLDMSIYRLFAYAIVPIRFDHYGGEVMVTAESLFGDGFVPVQPPAKGFTFLGYDVIQRWAEREPGHADSRALGGGFGCSPLSCNKLSREFDVSANCLLRSWEEARRSSTDCWESAASSRSCWKIARCPSAFVPRSGSTLRTLTTIPRSSIGF